MEMKLNILKWIISGVVCLSGLPSFSETLPPEKNSICSDINNEVFSNNVCTKIRTFNTETLSDNPNLLVVLHGDGGLSLTKQSYQYKFAEIIAKESNNLISVGMLRPGYTDYAGRISDGDRGMMVGDNYDEIRVKQIASSIETLKKYYKSNKVVLAGHSGGAAITANLISMHPDLIDHAILVSCACDLNAWRNDMYEKTQALPFNTKEEHIFSALNYSSPIDLVNEVSENTKISILVGDSDDVTKTYLSERYSLALKKAGKDVEFQEITGGHNIFLTAPVISNVLDIINKLL